MIPTDAKKVFEGVIFDVYQWEQKMFDGSTETFEQLKRRDSIQIIAMHGEKVLVVREEQPSREPFYGLLGGVIEHGEDPLEAGKRELLEEAGLESDDWELLFDIKPGPSKIIWKAHYYVARNCKKVAEPQLDPGEKIDVKELSFEDFLSVVDREDFRSKGLTHYVLRRQVADTLEEFKKQLFKSRPERS